MKERGNHRLSCRCNNPNLSRNNPKAVPTLSELLVSPDAEVRRAVASSLMHIRSPEAINLMISLLDDSDFEARYYVVVGLAETTDQMDWRPNMDNFRGDESKYLKHWLDWKTPPKTQQ
jgi:HEAT repeat protein